VYPDPRVTEFITSHFVTARVHIKEQPAMWHRFGVRWTPTVLVLAPDGKEVRRVEGYLPADELLGQLGLALGYLAVAKKEWPRAEQEFERVADEFPETDAAPEAQYWAGVARYSASHDASALKETARRFAQRYKTTSWAKRASVWAG
jgi:thioredoxin-like negative regulator of GroEL